MGAAFSGHFVTAPAPSPVHAKRPPEKAAEDRAAHRVLSLSHAMRRAR
ncbi:MAG: hypothetical protein ACLQAT_00710 [Candidatus Binataceae bacterium]